jgi:hypothetical protein
LFDEITDVMVLDVNTLGLGGSHVVGSKSDATLVILEGGSRASDGKTNCREKLTEKHGLLRRRCESHVFDLGCRERNDFWRRLLQETGPPAIVVMKLVRERRSTPSAKKESCQMRGSRGIETLKVMQ